MDTIIHSDEQLAHKVHELQQRIVDLEQAQHAGQRREIVLQQRITELETVLHVIPAMVYVKDREHRYTIANQTFADMAGTSVTTLLGKTDYDLFSPDVAAIYHTDDEHVMSTGIANLNLESQIETAGGEKHWIKAHNIPYRDNQGQVIGMVGVAIDITQQKKVEVALRQQSTEWAALLQAIPALVFFKDRNHRYKTVNEAYAKTFGATIDQIVGKTDHDFLPAELADEYHANDEAVMALNEARISDGVPIQHADGTDGWIVEHTMPYYDTQGEVTGLVGIGIDVTKRKLAEDALRQSEAHLRELVQQQEQLLTTIKVLSTPLLPIEDGILALPLVGHLDTARGQQVVETMLEAVQRFQAEHIIIDISGVPVIDTMVANYLLQATQAVSLLGARCVLVGISPEVAQTLVQLGVSFGSLITQRDVQTALVYARSRKQVRV
jgi:rsbT co-antagonist protein RsbR